MINKEELAEKNQLVNSQQWERIKKFQLENIIRLSGGDTDPLIIKGMLKNIHDTDKWEKQFEVEKNKTKE